MENQSNQEHSQDFYKTGSTNPPKKRGGLVAGLLVAVILLAGVSSILGVMNIQLFRMLQTEGDDSVSFVPTQAKATESEDVSGAGDTAGVPRLGLTAEDISELDQRFFGLPAGVLISDVQENGCAARAGIAPGDIILSFSGQDVFSVEELEQTLHQYPAEAQVDVVLYRHRTGMQHQFTVVLESTNG